MKPEKARAVEDVILRAAQMGQIVEKVIYIYNPVSVFPCHKNFTCTPGLYSVYADTIHLRVIELVCFPFTGFWGTAYNALGTNKQPN